MDIRRALYIYRAAIEETDTEPLMFEEPGEEVPVYDLEPDMVIEGLYHARKVGEPEEGQTEDWPIMFS